MRIGRGGDGDAQAPGEIGEQARQAEVVFVVRRDFESNVAAVNLAQRIQNWLGGAVGEQRAASSAARSGKTDQSFRVAGEQLQRQPVGMLDALRQQAAEAAVSIRILDEQHQRAGVVERHLAADDGVQAGGAGFFVERHRAGEGIAIHQPHGGHAALDGGGDDILHRHRAVEERVVAVVVERDPGHRHLRRFLFLQGVTAHDGRGAEAAAQGVERRGELHVVVLARRWRIEQ